MSAFDLATWTADFEAIGGSVRFDLQGDKLWLYVDDTGAVDLTVGLASLTGWAGRRAPTNAGARASGGRDAARVTLIMLDTAEELRNGPAYATKDDGPTILQAVIASRAVAADRN